MIDAGGFKVWPREVEEVLFGHPAVREAAVVAMPDAYCGERPMAYIALKKGQSSTEEALIAYCKEHLATFKAPCLIEFRDELPKLPTGKVLRRVLRDKGRRLNASGSASVSVRGSDRREAKKGSEESRASSVFGLSKPIREA
jgi:acyl-CoA synthetase (AMP-forming)/AMP-acid ligase II